MSNLNTARALWTYRYNRLLQEAGNVLGRTMGKPTDVWIKVTHRCKTRCRMCNIWQTPSRPDTELSPDQWKTVLDDLRSWIGPSRVSFIGGEPFAYPHLTDLFEHCAKIGLITEVITRGVCVPDEETAGRIVASGLNEYHVSIEGMRPEIHDYVVPPTGSFEKAVQGLEWLSEARRRQGRHMKIVIKTILMGHNRSEILRIVDWAQEQGYDELKFQPLEQTIEEPEDPTWYQRSDLWPADDAAVDELVEIVEELKRRKVAGAPIHNPLRDLENIQRYFRAPADMFAPVKEHVLSTFETTHERTDGWLEVWWDGDVRTSHKKPPLGNVTQNSIREIWRDRPRPRRAVRLFGLVR